MQTHDLPDRLGVRQSNVSEECAEAAEAAEDTKDAMTPKDAKQRWYTEMAELFNPELRSIIRADRSITRADVDCDCGLARLSHDR